MTLNDYLVMIPGYQRSKERFVQFFSAVLQQVIDLQAVLPGVLNAFTIDNANGKELDDLAAVLKLYRIDTSSGIEATDQEFRDYIKKKLILWNWDGRCVTAVSLINKISPGAVIVDNQNGTVSITDLGELPASVKSLLPIAAGIRIISS